MKSVQKVLLVLVLSLLALNARAASKEWLHIHVDDSRDSGERVRVNIPIALIEAMMPMVEDKTIREGRIHLHDKDLSVSELRDIWNAVKEEGDSEFISVEKKGEHVRVFTKGNFLMVESTENSHNKVNVKIPLKVVDAMLSGEGEELNLVAAVKALKDSGVRDIISVEDSDKKVMVWIDDKNIPSER